MAGGRAAEALPYLERAVELGSSLHTLESLAHGLAGAGQVERALAAYQQLAQGREFGWEGQLYWRLAPFTLGLLAERAGDTAKAAAAYAQFITQWPDAEPLPLLLDARARLARLESRSPS